MLHFLKHAISDVWLRVPSRTEAAAEQTHQTHRHVKTGTSSIITERIIPSLWYTLCVCLCVLTSTCAWVSVCVRVVDECIFVTQTASYTTGGLVKFTHIVMESLGLAGMFACLPPVRSSAVQIPEYTVHRTRERQQLDTLLCDPKTYYVADCCVSVVDMLANL